MVCSYCYTSGVYNIPKVGDCVACRRAACTHPSGRHDNKFHGYFCECQCNQFVCHVHYSSHSRTHSGSGPSTCFPAPTVASSGTTLSVIEHHLRLPFDMPSPIGELDAIGDFVLGVLSTPDEVRAHMAQVKGVSVDSVADEDLARSVISRQLDRVGVLILAPIAIHVLREAWRKAPEGSLPPEYTYLEPGVQALDDEFGLGRTPGDLLSDRSLECYREFSPRIAVALWELREQQRRWTVRPRTVLWSLFSPDAGGGAVGLSDAVRDEPPVLTSLLPQELQVLQHL